jgi:SAM-dependent methyltransferase
MKILQHSTDKEWERIGKTNPYYGVLSYDKYKSESLSEDKKREFFESGEAYISGITNFIKEHFKISGGIKRSLDFGCGVGRLVIPLASVSEHVTGVDVSDSMIAEAISNCRDRKIGNVSFVKSDDSLSRLNGTFDLIHSLIVFQHIPAPRGEILFGKLLSHLAPGGIGVFHFTYGSFSKSHMKLEFFSRLKAAFPIIQKTINLVKGRGWSHPLPEIMEMNHYDLNRLFELIHSCGAKNCYVDMTEKGGGSHHKHVQLFFQKN